MVSPPALPPRKFSVHDTLKFEPIYDGDKIQKVDKLHAKRMT